EQEATEDVSDHSVASALKFPGTLLLQVPRLETWDPVRVRGESKKVLDRHDRRHAKAKPDARWIVDHVDLLRLLKERLPFCGIGLGALPVHEVVYLRVGIAG